MKTMKKLIAIFLTVVMLVALVIPSNAMLWMSSENNTTNFIASEDKEILLNAGRLPEGTAVELGASDSDWRYAYPYKLNKMYTPGQYSDDLDEDVFVMYDNEYIYIREVIRTAVVAEERVIYRFILPNKVLATSGTKTPVGAAVEVKFEIGSDAITETAVNNTVNATTTSYAWTSNNTDNTLKAGSYVSSAAFDVAVTSCSRLENGAFVSETKIPLSEIGDGTALNAAMIGFKHRTNVGKTDFYQVINKVPSSGSSHAAGAKTYHDDWDYYAPMYFRGVDARASEQMIDVSWYDASKTEFEISTAGQLRGLSYLVNNYAKHGLSDAKAVTSGKTFRLTANIDLNPNWNAGGDTPYLYVWYPMAYFCGTFEGDGYAISGMYCDDVWEGDADVKVDGSVSPIVFDVKGNDPIRDKGFAAHLSGTTAFRNLQIINATIIGAEYQLGTIAGVVESDTTVELTNVYVNADISTNLVTSATTLHEWSHAGLLFGQGKSGTNWAVLKNVVITGSASMKTLANKDTYLGPLWGKASGTSLITDVFVNATTNQYKTTDGVTFTGYGGRLSWASYHGGNDTANKVDYYRWESNRLYDTGASTNSKVLATGYPEDWVCPDDANENIKMPVEVAEMISRNLWIQETDVVDGKFSVRILSVIDSIEWDKLGLKVEMKVGDGEFTDISADIPDADAVYTSVLAAGVQVDANKLGGKYISGVVLTNISATETVTFKVTPIKYVGETAYVNAHASTVTYVNGVLQK